MPISTQDLDQHTVLDSIPCTSSSDLISIKTLVDDYVSSHNPHLTNPLGPKFLQLKLDGSTPSYTFLPLSVVFPMEKFETCLPSPSIVSAAMSSFSPLSGAIPTPSSTSLTSS